MREQAARRPEPWGIKGDRRGSNLANGSEGTRVRRVRGRVEWLRRRNALTVEEVAAELGVTRRWVYELIEREEIDAVKIGRIWLVSKESVENQKKREMSSNSGSRSYFPYTKQWRESAPARVLITTCGVGSRAEWHG